MTRLRVTTAALIAFGVAALAFAQNADKNSAGPTKNDYRLRVVQPVEGAAITGDRFQIIVDTEIPGERDVPTTVNSMPRPDVDVFLDDLYQGTMRDEKNVIELVNVTPGPHEVVLLAKNRSGEIIDRKVLHVSAVARRAPKPAVVQPASPPPPPPPPAYEPPASPPPAPEPLMAEELPATGSAVPLLALAGAGFLLGGLLVRRLF
jgi:LPXTG-motif cell wall-anchored protein